LSSKAQPAKTEVPKQNPQQAPTASTDDKLHRWIHDQYRESAFTTVGFMGWKKFQRALIAQKPDQKAQINEAFEQVRQAGHEYSLQDPVELHKAMSAARRKQEGNQVEESPSKAVSSNGKSEPAPKPTRKVEFGAADASLPTFTFIVGNSASSSTVPAAPIDYGFDPDMPAQEVVAGTNLPLRIAQPVPISSKVNASWKFCEYF
jgi:hypothetical protein